MAETSFGSLPLISPGNVVSLFHNHSNSMDLLPTELSDLPSDIEESNSTSIISEAVSKKSKIIDDDAAYICFVVIKCAMYELSSLFGIVTNVICMVVFISIGFKETVNVSLLGLTISDLLSLIVLFWQGICFNPLFTYSDVHFDTLSVVYLSGGWPKMYLTRVTSCITAFVTLERCLCIAIPLKVKNIFTPKRGAYIIISLFFLLFMTMPAVYYSTGLGWLEYPDRNKTLLGLVYTHDRDEIYNIVVAVNFVVTNGSFFMVIACTLILVLSLKKKQQWRRNTISQARKQESISLKEQKVSKMVILISAIFLGCFFPGTVLYVVMLTVPEFSKGKLYHNLFTTVWAFSHILEAINASVNIFVYLGMSSKFRQVFRQKFPCLSRLLDDDDVQPSGEESQVSTKTVV